jgi:hypothetical protein
MLKLISTAEIAERYEFHRCNTFYYKIVFNFCFISPGDGHIEKAETSDVIHEINVDY